VHWSSAGVAFAIVAAASLAGAVALGAQAPTTQAAVPLASGARRQPLLEQQAGGSEAGGGRSIRVYRWASPIEPLVRYYIQALDARRDITPDSALQRPGETSRISYHLDFYSFEDECADAGAAAGGQPPPSPPATCKTWRRGKNKARALNFRLGYEVGVWVERTTFRWFSRDSAGAVLRWRAELRDVGLSNDWNHYVPNTQLTVLSEPVKPSVQ